MKNTIYDIWMNRGFFFSLISFFSLQDVNDRHQWLSSIRKTCVSNRDMLRTFHPGALRSGKWTCCLGSNRAGKVPRWRVSRGGKGKGYEEGCIPSRYLQVKKMELLSEARRYSHAKGVHLCPTLTTSFFRFLCHFRHLTFLHLMSVPIPPFSIFGKDWNFQVQFPLILANLAPKSKMLILVKIWSWDPSF